jgi:hypothetical protein
MDSRQSFLLDPSVVSYWSKPACQEALSLAIGPSAQEQHAPEKENDYISKSFINKSPSNGADNHERFQK